MTLKLNRPLCFFDLETTGVNVTKDRIIEIAVLKLHPESVLFNISLNGIINPPKQESK